MLPVYYFIPTPSTDQLVPPDPPDVHYTIDEVHSSFPMLLLPSELAHCLVFVAESEQSEHSEALNDVFDVGAGEHRQRSHCLR